VPLLRRTGGPHADRRRILARKNKHKKKPDDE
jgi:hypothetical protein